MKMNPLGRTGLTVSELCLGTMTFGTQTTEAVGHAQISRALEAGINFVDTAEMYPVNPVAKETIGRTEEIIGTWNAANPGRRGEFILATKHSGEGLAAVRDGAPISAQTIPATVEGSLRRLQTDYIDLYQFHWPNRGSYMFRKHWEYDPSTQDRAATLAHMEEALEALQRQVDKGNIRHFGLSNESAWGTAQWLRIADARGWPRVVTIQNEYSLLCRLADTDLAELMVYEDVGLLPFSPLGAGFLTGKYKRDDTADTGRLSGANPFGDSKFTDRNWLVLDALRDVASGLACDPAQAALAWTMARPGVTSTIVGARTAVQLASNIAAASIRLNDDQMNRLNEVSKPTDGFTSSLASPMIRKMVFGGHDVTGWGE